MNQDVWGVFHDGRIDTITGGVPGTVELHIEIAYLRRMFAGSGTYFRIVLEGCTASEYQEFDEPAVADLAAIAHKVPTVLYVASVEPVALDCTEGDLRLVYDRMTVFTDLGEQVAFAQLAEACARYWGK